MLIVFDIGGSLIRAAAGTNALDLRSLGECATPLADYADFVAALRTFLPQDKPDAAVKISITGTLDPETGEMTVANIPALNGRRLKADLEAALARSVDIANDADCFALAEAQLGAGVGHRVVFGAILGSGVGGGLIIDGRIHSGSRGVAGEWGHGPIAATYIDDLDLALPRFACGCGLKGCLDTIGGGPGLTTLYHHLTGHTLEPAAIVMAWREGEAPAARAIAAHRALLAPALAMVINIVGADIVPVGGGLGRAHDLVSGLDEAVRALMLHPPARPILVPAAVDVLTPGLVGAALLGA